MTHLENDLIEAVRNAPDPTEAIAIATGIILSFLANMQPPTKKV